MSSSILKGPFTRFAAKERFIDRCSRELHRAIDRAAEPRPQLDRYLVNHMLRISTPAPEKFEMMGRDGVLNAARRAMLHTNLDAYHALMIIAARAGAAHNWLFDYVQDVSAPLRDVESVIGAALYADITAKPAMPHIQDALEITADVCKRINEQIALDAGERHRLEGRVVVPLPASRWAPG